MGHRSGCCALPKALPAAGNKGFIVGPIHYQLLLLVGDVNTKSHGDCCRLHLFVVVGGASRKTSFPSCRPRHPQRHALHDDNSRHGSKSGRWPFKKSAVGGKKTADCKPLPNPPQGAGIHSRCALGGYDCAPFLEKDWNMNIIWAFFLPRGEG